MINFNIDVANTFCAFSEECCDCFYSKMMTNSSDYVYNMTLTRSKYVYRKSHNYKVLQSLCKGKLHNRFTMTHILS